MSPLEASVALNLLPGMGPVRLRRLLDAFGSPEAVLSANSAALQRIEGIGPEVASAIANWREPADPETELQRAADLGASVIAWDSPSYLKLLREIHYPPIVLYVLGTLEDRDNHAVGVVGARTATHYGTTCAKKLAYQLAYAGLTILSGLARGIDTAAHQGALAAKGRTIAVLGCGLGQIYPPENRPLAEKIAESGAVVSEFPIDRKPDRQTFPMRNRIVSGWSFGTLVIEAGLQSGALITANQAAEQGRSIYAVPGPIDRPTSHGTNRLIQQGAKLVLEASDILDDLGTLFRDRPALETSRPVEHLTETERAIYDAIGQDETHLDRIIAGSKLASGTVMSTLLALEMKRLVKQLPGRHFVKLV